MFYEKGLLMSTYSEWTYYCFTFYLLNSTVEKYTCIEAHTNIVFGDNLASFMTNIGALIKHCQELEYMPVSTPFR